MNKKIRVTPEYLENLDPLPEVICMKEAVERQREKEQEQGDMWRAAGGVAQIMPEED